MTLQHFNIHTWGRAGVFTLFFPGDPNFIIKILPNPKNVTYQSIERGELVELHRVSEVWDYFGHAHRRSALL